MQCSKSVKIQCTEIQFSRSCRHGIIKEEIECSCTIQVYFWERSKACLNKPQPFNFKDSHRLGSRNNWHSRAVSVRFECMNCLLCCTASAFLAMISTVINPAFPPSSWRPQKALFICVSQNSLCLATQTPDSGQTLHASRGRLVSSPQWKTKDQLNQFCVSRQTTQAMYVLHC